MNYKRSVDFRQIECFVACVQAGSISKAAELLHTAQPSVSKMIKSMEESIGLPLFTRYAKGTVLTPEGEAVYQYAQTIMENLNAMQTISERETKETLRLSNNPSSWFSDTFLEFYLAHQEENLHYQIYSAGTREIVQRLEERKDDVGFVYVVKNQKAAFQHYLMRNYLEFTDLAQTSVMLFSGSEAGEKAAEVNADGLTGLRLVQRFPDEFSPDNYWDLTGMDGHSAEEAETVVTTNSEYIMSRLLRTGNLSNISAAYLTSPPEDTVTGSVMTGLKEDRIMFGYIRRRGEELPARAEEFVEFVKNKLE